MSKFNEEDVYIFNPERECMSREDLKELQLKRLQKVVKYAYENVPFYQNSFDKAGVKIPYTQIEVHNGK